MTNTISNGELRELANDVYLASFDEPSLVRADFVRAPGPDGFVTRDLPHHMSVLYVVGGDYETPIHRADLPNPDVDTFLTDKTRFWADHFLKGMPSFRPDYTDHYIDIILGARDDYVANSCSTLEPGRARVLGIVAVTPTLSEMGVGAVLTVTPSTFIDGIDTRIKNGQELSTREMLSLLKEGDDRVIEVLKSNYVAMYTPDRAFTVTFDEYVAGVIKNCEEALFREELETGEGDVRDYAQISGLLATMLASPSKDTVPEVNKRIFNRG